ncbi:MAG: hypothetical protein N4A71_21775 [Carboxylicivirga sp.]|jgi:hypothetical protein|nr:hypothetical protein [Carboxylicivirga sp.]
MRLLFPKLVGILFFLLIGSLSAQSFGQNCNQIFDREDLDNELYTVIVRKHAFKVVPGKKILVSGYFFGGKGYLLDFLSEDNRKVHVRLLRKDRSEVLFETSGNDGISNLQVSYNITEKVLIEMTVEKRNAEDVADQCVGLLIRTFD